jgi:hypothetical protein
MSTDADRDPQAGPQRDPLTSSGSSEAAARTPRSPRASWIEKIIELLTVHTYIENEGMYPRVRKLVP